MRHLLLWASLLLVGCTTTEYVPLTPHCSVPPMPTLPAIDKGALWDALGDAEYRSIESYVDGLWSAIDEQRAILGEVCEKMED